MAGAGETWSNGWIGPNAGVWSSTSTPNSIFTIRASYNSNANCGPSVPNPSSVFFDIDFRNLYQQTGTKLAIEVRYLMYQDTYPNGGGDIQTSFLGDISTMIQNEFGVPPQQVDSTSGPIPLTSSYISVGSVIQPEYHFFYTIETTAHNLKFTDFPMTAPIQP